MAHMVETMAYAGETPWHGLGKKVPADLSPEQMLEAAGLDWEVEKRDLWFFDTNSEDSVTHAPGKQVLVRTSDNQILDFVGDDWNPLQNRDAFEFFTDFVNAGDMSMDTAGSLEDGRRVWALAKVNDAFEVFKDDVVENYLLFSNPHKYGMSIDVRMTPIRVVCNNTITLALNLDASRMVKVNHRSVFDPDTVKETLGVAKEKLNQYKEAAKFLSKKKYKNETLNEYLNKLWPASQNKIDKEAKKGNKIVVLSRTASQAADIVNTQPGAEFGRGTWWQAFNAVTYMTDHILGRGADTRINSAWYGINRTKKQNALKLAVEFAEAA